jgi:hypothetical protein
VRLFSLESGGTAQFGLLLLVANPHKVAVLLLKHILLVLVYHLLVLGGLILNLERAGPIVIVYVHPGVGHLPPRQLPVHCELESRVLFIVLLLPQVVLFQLLVRLFHRIYLIIKFLLPLSIIDAFPGPLLLLGQLYKSGLHLNLLMLLELESLLSPISNRLKVAN